MEHRQRYILPSTSPPRTTASLKSTGLEGRIPDVRSEAKKRGPKPGYKRIRKKGKEDESQRHEQLESALTSLSSTARSSRSMRNSDSKRHAQKARKGSNGLSPRDRSPHRLAETSSAAQHLQGTEKTKTANGPVQSKGQMLPNYNQISHIESQYIRLTESSGHSVKVIGNTHYRLGGKMSQVHDKPIGPAGVSNGARAWTADTDGHRAPSPHPSVQRTEESCWRCRVSGRICIGAYGKRCGHCKLYEQTCVYVVDEYPLPKQERDVAEAASHSIMKVESRCYPSGVPHEITELVQAAPHLRDCNGNLVVTESGALVFFLEQEFLYHPAFDSLHRRNSDCRR